MSFRPKTPTIPAKPRGNQEPPVAVNGLAYAHLQTGRRTPLPAIKDGEIPRVNRTPRYSAPTHSNGIPLRRREFYADRPMTQWVSKQCIVTIPGHRELTHGEPRNLLRFPPPLLEPYLDSRQVEEGLGGGVKPLPPRVRALREGEAKVRGGSPQTLMDVQALRDRSQFKQVCDWDDHAGGSSLVDLRFRAAEKAREQAVLNIATVVKEEEDRERRFRGAQSAWKDRPVGKPKFTEGMMGDPFPMEHFRASQPVEVVRVEGGKVGENGSPRESWNSSAETLQGTRSTGATASGRSSTTSMSSMKTALTHISSAAQKVKGSLRAQYSRRGGTSQARQAPDADSDDETLSSIILRHQAARQASESASVTSTAGSFIGRNLVDPWTGGKLGITPPRLCHMPGRQEVGVQVSPPAGVASSERGVIVTERERFSWSTGDDAPAVASSSRLGASSERTAYGVVVTERERSSMSTMSLGADGEPLELGMPQYVPPYVGKGKAPMREFAREPRVRTKKSVRFEGGEEAVAAGAEEGGRVDQLGSMEIRADTTTKEINNWPEVDTVVSRSDGEDNASLVGESRAPPGAWPRDISLRSLETSRSGEWDSQSLATIDCVVPGAFSRPETRDLDVPVDEDSDCESFVSTRTTRPDDSYYESAQSAETGRDRGSVSTAGTRMSVSPLRIRKAPSTTFAPAVEVSRSTRLTRQRGRSAKAFVGTRFEAS